MSQKTNTGLVEYCRAQLGKPYWYGTYGQTATIKLYEEKKKQYPGYYTASNFTQQLGQRVHDCVGLIKGYLWSDSPTSRPVYNAAQDVDVSGMLALCSRRGSITTLPNLPSILVFKNGHVGVYIGNGEVIEAKGHKYGVVKTKLAEGSWKEWGQCPWIEYSAEHTPISTPQSGTDKKTEDKAVIIKLNVLKKGSSGNQVRTAQRLLKSFGISVDNKSLTIDGVFGANTETAVKKYQAKNGLVSDGIIGEKTWARLTGGTPA